MDALQTSSQRVFIFEHDYDRLVRSKPRQEKRGNLFGLWTTDREPVIHIISGPNCCPESDHHGIQSTDILSRDVPLAHIGNWSYSGSPSERAKRERRQIDDLQCRHEQRSNFLDVMVIQSTLRVLVNGKEKQIDILPNESPFMSIEGIEEITIKGHNDESNTKLTKMKVTKASASSPNFRDQQSAEDSDSHDSGDELSPKGVQTEAFIFTKDYDLLLSKATQEEQGNLFGLWTTDGEPVIHIISGPNCCPRTDPRGPHLTDILSKDSPLTHIGNWRYGSVSSPRAQRKSTHQIDKLWCFHKQKTGAFLDVVVSESKIVVLVNGRERELKVLPTESPLRYMEGIKMITIEGQPKKENSDTELENMRHLSVARGFPRETRNSSDDRVTKIGDINRSLHGTQGFQREFAVNRHDFKVFMFEEDYQMMTNLVLKYRNLETGGDLFGLWTTKGNAVLHVVLGPGQNCKRTGASFYQSIPYLKRNGELLTEEYMLCHIGEWHSHHQLRLFQPSGGDSSTVIRNYPRGACGFLLIIANILSPREVELSPYLYTKTSSYGFDQKGELVVLHARNAFKNIRRIKESIDRGKELDTYSQDGLYHASEYLSKSHETSRYPVQTGQTPQYLHQTREPIKHGTPQQYTPKQRVPQARASNRYTPQSYGVRKRLQQPSKSRLTSSKFTNGRVNKAGKSTKQNKLDSRPKWK